MMNPLNVLENLKEKKVLKGILVNGVTQNKLNITIKKNIHPMRKKRNFDWYSEYREYPKPLPKLWKIYCFKCRRQYYTIKGYLKHTVEPVHRDKCNYNINWS